MIQGAGSHADQHFVGTNGGRGYVSVLQHFWSAVLFENDGLHASEPPEIWRRLFYRENRNMRLRESRSCVSRCGVCCKKSGAARSRSRSLCSAPCERWGSLSASCRLP